MQLNKYPAARCAAGLLALCAFALAGCRDTTAAADAANPAASSKVIVTVAKAEEGTLTRTASAQGALFPNERTIIAAEVNGTVAQVAADFGDSVKAGQVLLRLDSREYQLRVDSAQAAQQQVEARLKNTGANFDRAVELKSQGAISGAEYDRIASALHVDEADKESAEKALALARKKLGDTVIRAPFGGSVQKRMASLGEYITPGKELFELIAINPLKLRAPVPERFVPMVRVGMEVTLTVDATPGKVFSGNVTRVAPAIDDVTRTLLVEAEVANPDGLLKPGSFAHITANLGEDRALFVPKAAVLRYAGVARVFVIENDVAHTREVTTGDTLGETIEISQGLKAGETVATTEVDRLADGVAVDPRHQEKETRS